MKHTPLLLLALAAGVSAEERPPIATDRPGFSDGSNVVGKGITQLESGFFRTFAQGATTTSFGDVLVRVGMTPDFELRLIGLSYGTAPGHAQALLDPSIGFKYRLQRPSGQRGEITFIGQTTTPIGEHPLRANQWNPTAKIAWTTPVDGHTLGGNVVFAQIGSGPSQFDQGAVTLFYSRSVTSKLTLTQELWGVDRVGLGQAGGAFTSTALTYLVNNDTQLDLRLGTGFNQRRDGWFIQAGISRRF